MTKNILTLDACEALDFFMQSGQYHSMELPEYFDFNPVLAYVRDKVGDAPFSKCLSDKRPEDLENVNLSILLNKDGHYAVRPLIIANPFLYYFMAREICNNWKQVTDCFSLFAVPHVTACALPIIPQEKEKFYKSTTIINWWNCLEQRSIELSLQYRYMFVTDITNCYGCITPQSIEWALDRKNTKHETQDNRKLAEEIQTLLRALQHGRNIGIPQGSTLFDFVGEIVLGYADLLLSEALEEEHLDDYEIIRYRDDYRIFCNDKDRMERISYKLQSVLESLNLRMNSSKTKISSSIVTDSVKPDKLFYIFNTPIFTKKTCDFDSFEKHLFYILLFGRKFSNGGQLKIMLSDIDRRIENWLSPFKLVSSTEIDLTSGAEPSVKKETPKKPGIFGNTKIYGLPKRNYVKGGSARALVAVAAQIAIENVSVCHYALRVASRIIDSLDDMEEKRSIIDLLYKKLCDRPNSEYDQLWLQNMTYTEDRQNATCRYKMRLCHLVMEEDASEIWNNDWLSPSIADGLPCSDIVDRETLKKVTPVITFRERRAYDDSYVQNDSPSKE